MKIVDITPRDYQVQMMEAALKNNIVACLGTGTGKTFIGVLVIKQLAHQVRPPFKQDGKRTFFLVPTVPLVHQQTKVLADLTDLEIGGFWGDMKVDTWSKEMWHEQFDKYHVLVMTAEIFRVILEHGFMSLSKVNLIVFDECHRAVKNHPYREIMRNFDLCQQHPKVLGLTASILNGKCKPGQLEKKIKDLEISLRSKAIVPDESSQINKHGTKPKEYLCSFRPYTIPETDEEIVTVRILLITALEALPVEVKSSDRSRTTMVVLRGATASDDDYDDDDDKEIVSPARDARKYINDVKDILESLGPWCTRVSMEVFLEEINSTCEKGQLDDVARQALKIVKSVFQSSLRIIKELMRSFDQPKDRILGTFMPPKLQKLLDILNSKNPLSLKGDDPLCGVIFVQKRFVAYILNKWLKAVSQLPEYKFIKSNFMVGHGSQMYATEIKEICMASKQQGKILQEFREGKYNLLVASSVIEEGMDVPQCNLVVRFDPPSDFRAYVQSKGRARARNSIYILMTCNNNEDKFRLIDDLTNYGAIEKILLNFCQDRELPTEEDIDIHMADQLKAPYMPVKVDGGARVTMSSSISLLNRYCSKLKGDVFTHCAPRWKTRKVEMEGEEIYGYRCTIWMPLISPIRDPIVGDIMKNKHHAKMAAALDACRILHEHKELNDNLLPINLKDEVIGDSATKEAYQKELRLGASNTQNCYPKKVLSFKPVTPKTKCYLYILHMKLIEPLERDENETIFLFDPDITKYRFGLIASELVKSVIPFPIFTESGKVEVVLEKGKPFLVTERELQLLHTFHEYTITKMLNLASFPLHYFAKENRQWLLAPLIADGNIISDRKWSCDWNLMNKVATEALLRDEPQESNIRRMGTAFKSSDYDDGLVYPTFEPGEYYYVIKVDDSKTSTTTFPKEDFENYIDFFMINKKQRIKRPNDPLLEVKHVSHSILNVPGYFNRKGNFITQSVSRLARRVHFPPELVYILPYPGSLYRQAAYLPCILTRIQSLILSEDLRCTIVRETGLGLESHVFEPLSFKGFSVRDRSLSNQSKESSGRLEKIFEQPLLRNNPGPSSSLVLQAMTSKHYGDFFDLERLETVGDSFLKYAVSMYLFCKHPSDNEGKLTIRKTQLISNANLLKLGKTKGLPSVMFYTKMDPKVNWLPPGYKLPDGLEEFQSEFSIALPQFFVETELRDIWAMQRDELRSYIENRRRIIEENMIEQQPDVSLSRRLCVLNLRTQNCIGNKSVADCVEALLGAYVVTTGVMGGLRFLNWLGVKVIPDNPVPQDLQTCFVVPLQPVINQPKVRLLKEQYMSGLENLENRINYQFKNKMYLLEALWHPSCDKKPITGCYQRLEFLGDAVLDYVITRYLYEDPQRYNPGELTDIRMALVNNEFFAKLAVRFGFHKHMKYFSPALIGAIMKFVKKLENNDMDFIEEIQLKEECSAAAEELEVPKVLGDVVESVAGAIYLDCGHSLKTVWNVFYEMMHTDIETVRNNIPKNPVRIVYEEFPEKAKFHSSEESAGKKMKVILDVERNGEKHRFIGVAENKKTAKLTVARLALKKLCKKEELKNKMW